MLLHERSIHDIAERVAEFITAIGRLNLLTPQMHFERNFSDIVEAFDTKIKAENEEVQEAATPVSLKTLDPPDLSKIDLSHALRPEFTERVIRTLLERRLSVNLIGNRGAGRRRLLKDLEKCQLPDVKAVFVNLRNYVTSYEGFLNDVAGSLGL